MADLRSRWPTTTARLPGRCRRWLGVLRAPRSPTRTRSFRSSTPPTLATTATNKYSFTNNITDKVVLYLHGVYHVAAKRCMHPGGAGTILYNASDAPSQVTNKALDARRLPTTPTAS